MRGGGWRRGGQTVRHHRRRRPDRPRRAAGRADDRQQRPLRHRQRRRRRLRRAGADRTSRSSSPSAATATNSPRTASASAASPSSRSPAARRTLKIKRLNIAERLYRVTGEGIYRDTVLAGRKAADRRSRCSTPQVIGQDSRASAIYKGKIYWFWGDTNRLAYPLGNFGMAGAVSDLPGQRRARSGRRRRPATTSWTTTASPGPMVRRATDLRWLDGLIGPQGRRRHGAADRQVRDAQVASGQRLAEGSIVYDDEKDAFENSVHIRPRRAAVPRRPPVPPHRRRRRVRLLPRALPAAARARPTGTRSGPRGLRGLHLPRARHAASRQAEAKVDRDAAGKLVWAWKKNTPARSRSEQKELIDAGLIKPDEALVPPAGRRHGQADHAAHRLASPGTTTARSGS